MILPDQYSLANTIQPVRRANEETPVGDDNAGAGYGVTPRQLAAAAKIGGVKQFELVAAAELDAERGPAFWRAHHRNAIAGDGRRHQPQIFVLVVIPVSPAPQFPSGVGVVAADAIAAGDQHLALLVVGVKDRTAEGLE